MVRSLLLEGVSPQEYQTMRACLGVHEQSFRPDDVIYDFGDGRGLLGIVTEGSAVVERIDREGGRAILEHLEPGGVFGEMMMFKAAGDDSVVARSVTPCRVSFLRGEAVMRRCEHACACHGRMVENLGRGAQPSLHPGEAAAVFPAAGGQGARPVISAAFFPQCAGGLYLRRPQRHDARAEENAGGNAGDHHRQTGDIAVNEKHPTGVALDRVIFQRLTAPLAPSDEGTVSEAD